MITEKKNQHYIPKFYLRNFSYNGNKKQIGIFNTNNGFYFDRATLKDQASKDFFYGYDGKIEGDLSKIEHYVSSAIREVVENRVLPRKGSEEHLKLLMFMALNDTRNPVRIEGMKNMFLEMGKKLLEIDPNTDISKLVPSPSHQDTIKNSLSNIKVVLDYTKDLDFKLLINRTDRPFISSDCPNVRYNQFLELKKWGHSKTGYGTTGLQIFIPLSSEVTIIFFDSGIYKVGDKKKHLYCINKQQDVDSINVLQFVNCIESIYFDEKASEKYIKYLYNLSLKYKKANIARSDLNYIVK
ncbi:MAG TPA: DUF4238 domain-containing protein, partial [bacterium]|nr:DUF4238 domain-containing protein [bacterium]